MLPSHTHPPPECGLRGHRAWAHLQGDPGRGPSPVHTFDFLQSAADNCAYARDNRKIKSGETGQLLGSRVHAITSQTKGVFRTQVPVSLLDTKNQKNLRNRLFFKKG